MKTKKNIAHHQKHLILREEEHFLIGNGGGSNLDFRYDVNKKAATIISLLKKKIVYINTQTNGLQRYSQKKRSSTH